MLQSKAVDIFAIIQDKYNSPNLITSEVIDLLNMALTGEYMNRLFPDNQGGIVNFEFDANVTANIQPLVWTITANMNTSGVVTDTVINTALRTATGNSSDSYFRIGSIGWGSDGYPVKYVKQNNRWSFQRNAFKQPSTTNPRFTLIGTGLQFYPTDVTKTLTINVIKKPRLLAVADLATQCELGDYQMYNVIAIALKLAGVGTRDSEILDDIRLANLQITQ
jgi:hypothetical protein